MREVAVVTDSTQYLTPELTRSESIHVVSLYYGWNGEHQRESELQSYASFYERLRTDEELPTTSQPSIGDFTAVYEPLLEAGKDIVSVHIAGGISGTVRAATQAKELLDERGGSGRIEVLDGETSAGGLGMLALAGAHAAGQGQDLDAVVRSLQEARKQLNIWFCLDTLEYLRRGGRIGAAQAWMGGALKIKPILSLEYEITPVERVRTQARAFERMGEYAERLLNNGQDGWVVQHIQAEEQAQRLVSRCRELFDSEPLWVSEVGPVLGTYTGPGMLGVGGLPRRLVSASLQRG